LAKSASDSSQLAARKLDTPPQAETQVVIDFDDNRAASSLVGPYGQNLALIERRLSVVVDSRGNHITLTGTRDACDAARRVLETLYAQAVQGQDLAPRWRRARCFRSIPRLRNRRCRILRLSICASARCAPAPPRRTPTSAR
jgi:ribosomal protein S30